MVTKTCKNCGKEFEILACRVKQGRGKFCSKQCSLEASTNKPLDLSYIKSNSIENSSGCWEWKGTKDNKGYPRMRVKGTLVWVHKKSWELFNNQPMPKGVYACHTCDNPKCVNPEHIYVGNAQTNRQDVIRRNRVTTEALRSNKKIDWEVVNYIRSQCKPHKSYTNKMKELAQFYGIAYNTVRDIVWKRTWRF